MLDRSIASFAFTILLALPQAFAQRAVEPVRVNLKLVEETADNREFSDSLRHELNRFRDVAITTKRVDYDVTTVTTPITERGQLKGYACAVLIMTPDTGRFRLSIETGATLPAMAANLADYLNKQYFEKRGRK
jgi:hypothetical protein